MSMLMAMTTLLSSTVVIVLLHLEASFAKASARNSFVPTVSRLETIVAVKLATPITAAMRTVGIIWTNVVPVEGKSALAVLTNRTRRGIMNAVTFRLSIAQTARGRTPRMTTNELVVVGFNREYTVCRGK